MADIQRVMNGYINAKDAADYAEALELDEELIDGTDYRLVISNDYSGSYPPEK